MTGKAKSAVPEDGRRATRFRAVKPRRVFEAICDQIRQDLVDGKLKPGDKLPAERLLAEQFSVSRAALREALRALEFAGIIRLLKGTNGGAVILDGMLNTLTQSIADSQRLGRISLSQVAEARILIQELVVRLAVGRATRSDFDALTANIERTREFVAKKDHSGRREASAEFYSLLAMSTRNELIVILNEALATIMQPYVAYVVKNLDYDIVGHRHRFLQHFMARNEPKAVSEITTHLRKIHEIIADKPIK